jgi:hypothetical protein
VVIYYLISSFYRRTSVELQRLEALSRSPLLSHFSETLAGRASIRAYAVIVLVVSVYVSGLIERTGISRCNGFRIPTTSMPMPTLAHSLRCRSPTSGMPPIVCDASVASDARLICVVVGRLALRLDTIGAIFLFVMCVLLVAGQTGSAAACTLTLSPPLSLSLLRMPPPACSPLSEN